MQRVVSDRRLDVRRRCAPPGALLEAPPILERGAAERGSRVESEEPIDVARSCIDCPAQARR